MAVPTLIMKLLFPVISVTAMFLLCFVAMTSRAGVLLRASPWPLPSSCNTSATVRSGSRSASVSCRCAGWAPVFLSERWSERHHGYLGVPFSTSSFSYFQAPLIGSIPVASAFLFDLAVFALVVGATTLMLIALAHQSVRSHRRVQVPANVADPARGTEGGMMEVVLAPRSSEP